MVSDLRDQTGAGLLDCKKALTEANGNVEEAITILRKKGAASAAKKADRATQEGLIESYIHVGGKVGVMIEVNCETDFVARNDEFKVLVPRPVPADRRGQSRLRVAGTRCPRPTWPRSARSPPRRSRASRPRPSRRSSRASSRSTTRPSACSTSRS